MTGWFFFFLIDGHLDPLHQVKEFPAICGLRHSKGFIMNQV
jgi:hypothetical protein